MKFSFINACPNDDLIEGNKRKTLVPASWPPLGILYLATTLQMNGIDVSVLDQPAKGFTVKETVNWVRKEGPDLLGFTTCSSSSRSAAVISKKVKEENPNRIIIFGGHHATSNPDRILRKYPSVDVIVKGEGEYTVVDLVDALTKRSSLKAVQGITYRNGDTIVSTPDRPLIEDLDALPFPDRGLLDVEYYSMIGGAQIATQKFTSILSSRGCAFRCRFCSAQKFARNIWRPRSVANIIDELCYLSSEGFKQFIFVDDNFTLNQKRVITLCQSIRKEHLDIEWFCEGRVDNSSYTMMKALSSAGCKVIFLGIESANQRILNYYNKQITPHQSKLAVNTARKAGIDAIIGAFILGAPNETREEIQNTLEFAKQLPIDFPRFNILGAYPGTDIWDELKMTGALHEDSFWETGISVPKICQNAVSFQEIQQMVHDALNHFLQRPSFIVLQLARLVKSSYRMKFLTKNLNRLNSIRQEFVGVQRLD
jgi:radical SAM superfamily enzyme YgiQ (UPF0313 family)